MNHCSVCEADIIDRADTCGPICARILKHNEPRVVATIRHTLTLRNEPCGDNCPGWAVFNADSEPVLQPCIDCWYSTAEHLTDEDVEQLPEAQHELERARKEGAMYEQPDVGYPCTCGCIVFRAQFEGGEREVCSACGVERQRQRDSLICGNGSEPAENLVRKYLDCSTGCLPEDEFQRLEGDDDLLVNEDDCWIEVWVWPLNDERDKRLRESFPYLTVIVDIARKLGCGWVNFDRDAQAIDGLPVFDW